jgi:hypothetical protein
MAFLVAGTDRRTDRPTRFISNAMSEALARQSADTLGVDVASVEFVDERSPRDIARSTNRTTGAPADAEPGSALAPPAVAWPGEWEAPQADEPRRRWAGAVAAIGGLVLLAVCLYDLKSAVPDHAYAVKAHKRFVDGVLPGWDVNAAHHRPQYAPYVEAERVAIKRLRLDGFGALAGLILLTTGLRWHRSNSTTPRLDNADAA